MKMPKVFAIGDLHLSFTSEKPMGIFGANWEAHHQKIELNWRATVSETDVVFILGDISWALKLEEAIADLRWIMDLPGRKVRLKGNHDLWGNAIGKLRTLFPELTFIQNDSYLLSDGRTVLCGSRAWTTPEDVCWSAVGDEKIYTRELGRLRLSLESAVRTGASDIIMGMHFPPTNGGQFSGFTELIEAFGVKAVAYGHLHGPDAFKKGLKGLQNDIMYYLASADFTDFKPIPIWAF
jgi:predicted phosphohydrolase